MDGIKLSGQIIEGPEHVGIKYFHHQDRHSDLDCRASFFRPNNDELITKFEAKTSQNIPLLSMFSFRPGVLTFHKETVVRGCSSPGL